MRSVTSPEMLFVHLGGNDLVSTPVRKLTEQAQCDMKALAELCPHTALIWSDVLLRIKYRGDNANNKMEKNSQNVQFIHESLWKKTKGKSD